MSRSTVDRHRERLRSMEDELTRASTLLSVVGEYAEAERRGAPADAGRVKRAFERFLVPGPASVSNRGGQLSYLREPVESGKDFFALANDYAGSASNTATGDESLSDLVGALDSFVANSTAGTRDAAATTFDRLLAAGATGPSGPPMSAHLAEVATLLAESARARRDAARDALNNDYADDADDGTTVEEKGAVQAYVEGAGDPVTNLDDHPVALLPVKLETRFVRPPSSGSKDGVTNPELYEDMDEPQLWVRVYPDTLHVDGHETGLTDEEVTLGRDFWAYCWYATHESLPLDGSESAERSALSAALDSDRRADTLAGLDPRSFPEDPAERKAQVKERAWKQLVDRFGRERAAYVVRELLPETDADVLLSVRDDPVGDYPDGIRRRGSVPSLSFPDPERKPDGWNRPPRARLLPDQWLVYGVWVMDEDAHDSLSASERRGFDRRQEFLAWSNAVREPLPVGPTPGQVAAARPDGGGSGAGSGNDEALAWLTAFGEAEKAGMAFRVTGADVAGGVEESVSGGRLSTLSDAGGTPGSYVPDVTDGRFEKLVVAGAKTTMDGAETAERLERLFDAHHFTDGVELLEVGTPTNNHDRDSGYSTADDPAESLAVECRPRSRVAHGDNSDGDRLARALAIDPDPGEEHVFGWVEGADATGWLDGWHARSALWPATAGYYLQNMLIPNSLSETQSLFGEKDAPSMGDVSDYFGWYEAYGRHFVNYVSPYGPLPSFRVDTQPYGVLPVTPTAEARRDPFDDDLLSWRAEDSGLDDYALQGETERKIDEVARRVAESGVLSE